MKLIFRFRVIERNDVRLLEIPAFPEIVVKIDHSIHDAFEIYAKADKCIRHAIQARLDLNDDIPDDCDYDQSADWSYVRLSPLAIMKVLLHLECRRRSWSKSALARNLEVTPTTASRLLDLFHESRSEVLTHAFHEMGLAIDSRIDLVRESSHAATAG